MKTLLRLPLLLLRPLLLLVIGTLPAATLSAAVWRETAHLLTDKSCYVAGECLHVSLCLTDESGQPSDISRVAYIEVCDAEHLCAQGMAALERGRGWADIPLPATLHSGTYLLSVYTRAILDDNPTGMAHQVITLVNTRHLSRQDNLLILDAADGITFHGTIPPLPSTATLPPSAATVGVAFSDTLPPSDGTLLFATLSVTCDDLTTPDYSSFVPTLQSPHAVPGQGIAEVEGHIVGAAASQAEGMQARMAMVGGHAVLFDGQPQPDGTVLFYTDGIYGSQPTLLAGNDTTGTGVAWRFTSPYAQFMPQRLPHAQVRCTREALQSRSVDAQLRAAFTRQHSQSTQVRHDEQFYATTPMQYYDLDEWTRLNSVREILIEFVRGVKRIRQGERTELHVYDTDESRLSEWPALVLLDGVPVYDIDEFLDYDARLLKYVQVYSGRYTFGSTVCQGVISFVSQHGLLPNRRLDASVQLVTRVFPQQRPAFSRPVNTTSGTLWWDPDVDPRHLPTADSLRTLCPPGATATLRLLLRDGTVVTHPL